MADDDYWRADGVPLGELVEEVRTFKSLELTFHAPVEIVREIHRDLREHSGNFQIEDRSDGGFVAVDTSDGNNNHTLQPPSERQDVRRQLEWVAAADYNEEMLDSVGEKYEVELEFIPQESKRQYSGHTDDDVGPQDMVFEFDAGTVATRDYSSEIHETSEDGIEGIELDLVLSGDQVRKVEESARRLAGTRVREQVDGTSVAEDNSVDEVNTFYLRPPDGAEKAVDPGWYICMGWETAHQSQDIYEVAIDAIRNVDKSAGFGRFFGRTFGTGPEHERELDELEG